MIPYGIDTHYRRFPLLTFTLIVANTAVFIFLQQGGMSDDDSILSYMLWPNTINPLAWVTSGFMHANILHLGGNMLFLWVYGRYVEERLGGARFFFVYMLTLVVASLSFLLMNYGSGTPALGASGAVSGTMGFVLATARALKVKVVFWYLYPIFLKLSVAMVLGLWLFEQFLIGMTPGGSGIAVEAHIGGFVAGFLLGISQAAHIAASEAREKTSGDYNPHPEPRGQFDRGVPPSIQKPATIRPGSKPLLQPSERQQQQAAKRDAREVLREAKNRLKARDTAEEAAPPRPVRDFTREKQREVDMARQRKRRPEKARATIDRGPSAPPPRIPKWHGGRINRRDG